MSYYEQAVEKLRNELKEYKGDKYGNILRKPVHDVLVTFCGQNEEFAQAVAQSGSFRECMAAVTKGLGHSISDLDVYKRAVAYYFDGATIRMEMTVQLEPAKTEPRGGIVLDLTDSSDGVGI